MPKDNETMKNDWKQYSIQQGIEVDYRFVWRIIKLWLQRKSYTVTISFHAKHDSNAKIAGAQIEY